MASLRNMAFAGLFVAAVLGSWPEYVSLARAGSIIEA